jgi:hypothetical protein
MFNDHLGVDISTIQGRTPFKSVNRFPFETVSVISYDLFTEIHRTVFFSIPSQGSPSASGDASPISNQGVPSGHASPIPSQGGSSGHVSPIPKRKRDDSFSLPDLNLTPSPPPPNPMAGPS